MATIDFTDNVTLVPASWLNDVDALVYQGVTAAALVGSDGTVGAPAYSFSGDTDSGLYRIGANNLGVAVNGAKVLDIATTGLTVVGAAKLTTTDTGPSASAFSIAGTVLSSKGTGNTYWSGYTSGATSEFGMLFGSNNTENDANIVWKKASNFLQIGANPPSATIHIVAAGSDMATFSSTGLAVTGVLTVTPGSADNAITLHGHSNAWCINSVAANSGGIYYHLNFSETGVGITSNGTTVSYPTTSDRRKKVDRGLATDTDVLKKTVVHAFSWKETGIADIGVFAQEAIAIKPIAVTKGDDDPAVVSKTWGVDYSKYVPDLILGWKNHEARVAAIEAAMQAHGWTL